MTGVEKLLPEHKQRHAVVYARQSTTAQVFKHHTSTERQVELTGTAAGLGWTPAQVELIADDLGRSGKYADNREGFQRLATEVSLGRVGAIFSLDASRLARSSADWHRLIEVAALTRTLLVDEQAIYDPRDPNDRLLLGMKGTMADFELVWLRQRMEGGRRHLAQKAELRMKQPVGYVWDGNRLVMDPNEEVRRALALLFERNRVAASCREVTRYFRERKLLFPARRGAHEIKWQGMTRGRVKQVLQCPIYTGTYVWGRWRTETRLVAGQRRRHTSLLPMSEWAVIKHGTHEGYISWEEFVANQKRLQENGPCRPGGEGRGAAREGAALLQGLLLCGQCGSRLSVGYTGQNGRYPFYFCSRGMTELGRQCLSTVSRMVEEPVVEVVLSVLTRANLEAATNVVGLIEQEDAALDQQWKLRLERTRYEARRAERQYDACDPENRVVARTLETRWNERLMELEKLEHDFEQARARTRLDLTDIDRQRIMALAQDVPKLWLAPTTTNQDRKILLRLLLQDIGVNMIDVPRRALRLRLLWHTRAVTEIEVDRPQGGGPRKPVIWRVVGTSATEALPPQSVSP